MWHPWRTLREHPWITLHWSRNLPTNQLGQTCHDTHTITLADGLTQVERRCTLTHELLHVHRGPVPDWCENREERQVDEAAARLLITLDQLADGLLWAADEHELADELWVDVPTVRTRLASLTDAETRHLNNRLDTLERALWA
jgi:hypothetical protein